MTRLDPIIAVENVETSAEWYGKIFGFNKAHGGKHFAVLTDRYNEVMLCLHAWEMDNHPTMQDQNVPAGNGLVLYFRTDEWRDIKKRLEIMGWEIEEETHLNTNSLRQEFSFRDPNGYFITVTEFHTYRG